MEQVRSVAARLALLAALWSCSILSVSAQPEDANTLRARELFERGVAAYDKGVYYDALQAFQEAYQLRPHPSVRVNIANCYDKLDRPAEAIAAFEQFLGSGAGSPQQQTEVQNALEGLRKRVGRLVLKVSPDGARVVIDNGEERRSPLPDAVLLKVGRHQVNVALDGHETALRVIDIQSDAPTELNVNLMRLDAAPIAGVPPLSAAAAAAAPAPTPPPAEVGAPAPKPAVEPEGSPVPASVWISGGVTFAALMGSIVTGQLALAADREFNADLAAVRNLSLSNSERAEAWDEGQDAADRAHTYAVVTDVLLSTAVVGAVVTTVLYLNHKASGPKVETTGTGLRLSGNF